MSQPVFKREQACESTVDHVSHLVNASETSCRIKIMSCESRVETLSDACSTTVDTHFTHDLHFVHKHITAKREAAVRHKTRDTNRLSKLLLEWPSETGVTDSPCVRDIPHDHVFLYVGNCRAVTHVMSGCVLTVGRC